MLIPQRILQMARVASTEGTSYQLNGLFLERKDGQAFAVATDRKILISATWHEDNGEGFPDIGINAARKEGFQTILPTDEALAMAKAKLGTTARYKPILQNVALDEHASNGRIPCKLTDLDTTRSFEPLAVEGTYPDWRKAFKAGKAHYTFRLDLVRLRDLCDAILKVHGNPKDLTAIIDCFPKSKSESAPITLTTKDDLVTLRSMIMPLVVKNEKEDKAFLKTVESDPGFKGP